MECVSEDRLIEIVDGFLIKAKPRVNLAGLIKTLRESNVKTRGLILRKLLYTPFTNRGEVEGKLVKYLSEMDNEELKELAESSNFEGGVTSLITFYMARRNGEYRI